MRIDVAINRRREATASGGALAELSGAPAIAGEALRRASGLAQGVTYVTGAEKDRSQSYAELLDEALRILGGLRERGLGRGDAVVFQLELASDFVPLLWACLVGGHVAVPVAVAPVFSADNAGARKLHNIWTLMQRPLVVTDAANAAVLGASTDLAITNLASIDDLRACEPLAELPAIVPEDTALVLFTSGSTGQPKGVVLDHRNILAMAAGTAQMNGFGADDVALNWMPLDHVGAIVFLSILPVWLGASQIHVPTRLIVEKPLLWLALIERYRGSISWAPNFAFDLVNQYAGDLAEPRFDLSSMRFLVNAGEQVAAPTARRFLEILESQKLPVDALRPAFGMSETCSGVTWSGGLTREQLQGERPYVSLGGPIPGAEIRITGENGEILRESEIGQLELRGASVTSGYFENPAVNTEAFTSDGWFRSGDLGFIEDGELHVTGRAKEELIVNGRNFPTHEIEAAVEAVAGVAVSYTCAFSVRAGAQATEALVVTFVAESADEAGWPDLVSRIRRELVQNVGIAPAHLIPLAREDVPRTGIGKIQRSKLKDAFERGDFAEIAARFSRSPASASSADAPVSEIEAQVAEIWRTVLGVEAVGRNDNFFDLGGHSLALIKMHARIEALFGPTPLSELFMHTTVAAQARHFGGQVEASAEELHKGEVRRERIARRKGGERETDIAVIGMAGRFPGADDLDTFWRNLCEGVESIRFFSDEEIAASGVDERSSRHPDYVKASPVLNDAARFDAGFFGFTEKEAEAMDPQHRLFLECCWETMEHAGYDPLVYPGAVALYAGASMNTYLFNNVMPNRERFDRQDDLRTLSLDSMGGFQLMVANDKDYLNTRVSYKLNLRGPSINVQTACSTGLVVIHQAIQSLVSGECDMALAGTSCVQSPQAIGHLYQEGMIVSPDGHCRAFDAKARGTIFGSGVGAVLLKRLSDAERDGDHILAVVKGSAVNNDGRRKVGYMAPSEAGESDVVREALDMAGVDAGTIGFVEAHGTGTEIGDPIEVSSLTRAFRADSQASGFCALGSVKTNVGHLQISSGIVGFIKAVLALHHKTIPATLHYEEPNPAIDFGKTPFFVNTSAIAWPEAAHPRRAGVNSLGIGGTNAHVILEEAPQPVRMQEPAPRPAQILALSARGEETLAASVARLRDFVEAHPETSLADLCFTANTGRHHFKERFSAVFATREELLAQLAAGVSAQPRAGSVAFMFTGQGSQYSGMARALYESCPVFRAALDRCAALLEGELDRPLLDLVFDDDPGSLLDETINTQPALFSVEYALAQLWLSLGIEPSILIGHSVGEYVAACLADVFSLEDALALICARARLMQGLPRDGAMVAVMTDEAAVAQALEGLSGRVAIAAINGEKNVVVSGSRAEVEALVQGFEAQGVQTLALKTSHAFHSPLMQPVLAEFRGVAEKIAFSPPKLPIVSNLTGMVESALLADPEYWVRHIVEPVRFLDGIRTLDDRGCGVFLEIGPKPVLAGMVRAALGPERTVLATLRPKIEDERQLLDCLAALYRSGQAVAWGGLYESGHRRVPLPTYPFARTRYWLEPPERVAAAPATIAERPPVDSLHPLIDRHIQTPGLPQVLFETQLDPRRLPLLEEHRVFGRIVVAGAGHLSMLLGAAGLLTGHESHAITGVTFPEALLVPDDAARTVQVQFAPERDGHGIRLLSFDPNEAEAGDYQLHLTGMLEPNRAAVTRTIDRAVLRGRCGVEISGAEIYARLAAREIALGPDFSWISTLWRGEGEALFEIRPPAGVVVDPGFQLHPGLIDSLLQPSLMVLAMGEGDETYVPFALEAFRFHRRPAAFPLWGHAVRRAGEGADEVADIVVFDDGGNCVAEVEGFEFRRADKTLLLRPDSLHDALYDIAWREIPARPQADAAAASHAERPLRELMSRRDILTAGMSDLLAEVNGPHYRSQSDDLETLGLVYIVDLLRDADAMPAPGATLSIAEIVTRLDAAPHFLLLVTRLLRILEHHGRLIGLGELWEGVACPDLPHRADQIARIRSRHGERAEAELTLLTRCGEPLPAIVSGREDPLEALFPGGDLSLTTKLYRDSAGFRALNTLVANAVEALAAQAPKGRPFRVLEIGAGTGATSHYVLSRLDPQNAEYCFTDISNLFLARARERFSQYGFIDYRLVDIERSPSEQGVAGEYDLIIAANVLHATRDIGQTLTNVRKILRPGGHLALLEVNVPTVPVDLTFGLLEGWWRFTDHELRPDYPLLSQEQWIDQLEAHGFGEAIVADIGIPSPGGLQSVFIARADEARAQAAQSFEILADSGGVGTALALALEARGQSCRLATEDDDDLDEILLPEPQPRLVVDLRGLDAPEGEPMAGIDAGCGGALDLVSDLCGGDARRVHLITRGAVGVRPDDAVAPVQAAMWGLGRVLLAEHPAQAGGLIDLDPTASAYESAQALAEALLSDHGETEIAIRGGQMLAPRLVSAPQLAMEASAALDPQAVYLITGGLGGIGLHLAQALVVHGARRLVLVGRSEPGADARNVIAGMEVLGVLVQVAQADVRDEDALQDVIAMATEQAPLKGVFHLAGVLQERLLELLSPEELLEAVSAKVLGAWHLDRLTRETPLDMFVMFSSVAGLLGLPGQGAYAAANAWLDAFAHDRRAQGAPALAIDWGRWSQVGMVAAEGERLSAQGFDAIEPDAGTDLLFELLAADRERAIVLPARFERLLAGRETTPSLLRDPALMRAARTKAAPAPVPLSTPLKAAAASLPARPNGAQIEAYLVEQVRQVLGAASAPDPQRSLLELGLDSLMNIDLRNRITRAVGINLPLGALIDTSLAQLGLDLMARLSVAGRAADHAAAEDDAEEEILL
jgi:acyl transferase domain-containing protein/acyl-CoA synthetase (AMP-forming)/AMP-acid ligase II/acyl carrier protein/phospholipid N-methyltransferase